MESNTEFRHHVILQGVMYVYLIYVHHAHLFKNRSVEKVYFSDYRT